MTTLSNTSTSNKDNNNLVARLLPLIIVVAVWVVISFVVAMNAEKWFMPKEGEGSVEAELVDGLFQILLGLGTFIFLLVQSCVYWFGFRYGFMRDRKDESDGPPIHGNNTVEILWTLAPTIIVFFLTAASLDVLIDTTEAKPNETRIHAFAQRFLWQFQYPDEEYELISNGLLVVPKGQAIRMEMSSRDVIHAFWVPAFRVKQDVMPGRTTEVRFTPKDTTEIPPELLAQIEGVGSLQEEVEDLQSLVDELTAEAEKETPDFTMLCPAEEETQPEEAAVETEGETQEVSTSDGGKEPEFLEFEDEGFPIVCAELCGADHGIMRGVVFVVDPEVYDLYLESLRLVAQRRALNQQVALKCGGEKIKEAGRDLFTLYGCNTCHQLVDAGSKNNGQGPSLNNVVGDALQYGSTDDPRDYIRTSIINPNAFIVPNCPTGSCPTGVMPPNFIDRIPPAELDILVEYLAMQEGQ